MGKCHIELPDDFSALAPETRCCRITATLRDGKTVVAEHRRSLADDAADTGWDQAVGKFKTLAHDLLPEATIQRVIDLTAKLDQASTLDSWLALLHIAPKTASVSA